MTWWIAAFAVLAVFFLFALLKLMGDLVRTAHRIEARLTLLNPLKSEDEYMEANRSVRYDIEARASHPFIWVEKSDDKEEKLEGKQLEIARRVRKFRERKFRN